MSLRAEQRDRAFVLLMAQRLGDLQPGLAGTNDDNGSIHAGRLARSDRKRDCRRQPGKGELRHTSQCVRLMRVTDWRACTAGSERKT